MCGKNASYIPHTWLKCYKDKIKSRFMSAFIFFWKKFRQILNETTDNFYRNVEIKRYRCYKKFSIFLPLRPKFFTRFIILMYNTMFKQKDYVRTKLICKVSPHRMGRAPEYLIWILCKIWQTLHFFFWSMFLI